MTYALVCFFIICKIFSTYFYWLAINIYQNPSWQTTNKNTVPIYSKSTLYTFTLSRGLIKNLLSLADQTDRDDIKYTNLLVHHISSSISTLLSSLTLKCSRDGIHNIWERYGGLCLYYYSMSVEHPIKSLLLGCCVQESGCPAEEGRHACHIRCPTECVDATWNDGRVVQRGHFQILPVVEEEVAD